MRSSKADIIAQLQKEILPLQGLKSSEYGSAVDVKFGPIKHAFANDIFPLGAIHEFFCNAAENTAATTGFITGILSSLMQNDRACIWISARRTVFPPALKLFGVEPDKIIFINCQKEKDVLWSNEEALKCDGLVAVIAEIQEISFNASRRLQLAVEKSNVTGFILRENPRNLATACVARWKITSLPTESEDNMPGIGFPKWNIELLKVRNGQPGNWEVMWKDGQFQQIPKIASIILEQTKKTG
jgi:protein ImuA